MQLEEAVKLAQSGVKMTHEYFTSDEYMIMKGNQMIFEDGAKMFLADWKEGKSWVNYGWSKFIEKQ